MRKSLVGVAAALTTLALTPAAVSAATITPSSTLDDGTNCTLREAVAAAVANADGAGCDTEVIGGYNAGAAPPDEIVLNMAGPYVVDPTIGQIVVGAGGAIVIRSDNPSLRRTINMAASVPFENRVFILTDAASDLTLRTLTINNADDVASFAGGVVYASAPGNKLTLDNSALDATMAGVNAINGGVVRIDGASSTLMVTDSVITGGNVSEQGGGIYSQGAATTITRSRIEMNDVSTGSQGGGISQSGGSLTITDSQLFDNDVDTPGTFAAGGAVYTEGTVSPMTVKRSLISGSSVTSIAVERGGGLFLSHAVGTTLIANSTIHNNTAGAAGGPDVSSGGGIRFQSSDPVTLNHVTFLGNDAFDATGADHISSSGLPTTTYTGSIISGGNDPCQGATMMSGGFNALSFDPDCPPNGTTDVGVVGPPVALANNGGTIVGGTGGTSIRSLAITDASSAFDLVPNATCTALTGVESKDQRGVARPISAACDAGAFEAPCTTPSALPGLPGAAGNAHALTGSCPSHRPAPRRPPQVHQQEDEEGPHEVQEQGPAAAGLTATHRRAFRARVRTPAMRRES